MLLFKLISFLFLIAEIQKNSLLKSLSSQLSKLTSLEILDLWLSRQTKRKTRGRSTTTLSRRKRAKI